ncbi:hypothetical protein CAEBREN_06827 [Caenorhabditis brenneri]|uniref:Uncharacterized protein n=1 Tax=Caenorhabditis brenneri TaxID=135651 RepID=G0N496_CAEBE|nr:hypothetical protein CAEBREN_06827 [Caenorhabditis brenneri]
MPAVNKFTKTSIVRPIRMSRPINRRNASPAPPPHPTFLQHISQYVPFVLFGLTVLVVLLQITLAILTDSLDKEFVKTRALIEKAPFDKKALQELKGMINQLLHILRNP